MNHEFLARAEKIQPQVVQWRHHFHQHPEKSLEERETTAKIADILKELGYINIRIGVPGRPDVSLVADLNDHVPGKRVALRADIDALVITEERDLPWKSVNEGLMHACGHDAHTAMLLGAAAIMASHADKYPGKIRLIFQHAEEVGLGAREMIANDVLDGVDFVLGQHIWSPVQAGKIALRPGPIMASADKFEVTLQGRGGHGSMPHLSHDPVVAACALVGAWQSLVSRETDPLDSAVLSVGQITSGTIFNAIPDSAYLQGTTRTFRPEVRDALEQRMGDMAQLIAQAYGCDATFTYHRILSSTINDDDGALFVMKELKKLLGDEAVYQCPPTMGGEDFGEYTMRVPGVFMFLGTANEALDMTYPHHHPKFCIDDDVLPLGVAALAWLTKAWLEQNQ